MVQAVRAGCRAEPRLITATPAARSTDPESSHLAAEEVTRKGQRARQQHAVLAAVHQHPGLTSRELARRTGIDRYTISRRLPELATAGRLVAILPASHAGRDILPNLKTQWSRVYKNEFAGTSVDVVILTADREAA